MQSSILARSLQKRDTTLYLRSLAPFGEAFWEVSQVRVWLSSSCDKTLPYGPPCDYVCMALIAMCRLL
jgi:hypothetical protein